MNEVAAQGTHVVLDHSNCDSYVHIEDGACLRDASSSGASVTSLVNTTADWLEALGFVVGDRAPDGTVKRYVGYSPQRTPARLTLPADRAVPLQIALNHLSNLRQAVVDELHSVVSI